MRKVSLLKCHSFGERGTVGRQHCPDGQGQERGALLEEQNPARTSALGRWTGPLSGEMDRATVPAPFEEARLIGTQQQSA